MVDNGLELRHMVIICLQLSEDQQLISLWDASALFLAYAMHSMQKRSAFSISAGDIIGLQIAVCSGARVRLFRAAERLPALVWLTRDAFHGCMLNVEEGLQACGL